MINKVINVVIKLGSGRISPNPIKNYKERGLVSTPTWLSITVMYKMNYSIYFFYFYRLTRGCKINGSPNFIVASSSCCLCWNATTSFKKTTNKLSQVGLVLQQIFKPVKLALGEAFGLQWTNQKTAIRHSLVAFMSISTINNNFFITKCDHGVH